MIDFTDYWHQCNLSQIVLLVGLFALIAATTIIYCWGTGIFRFRTIVGEYVWGGIAVLLAVVTVAAVAVSCVYAPPTLGEQLGTVYGIQTAQASDDVCGRTLNSSKMRERDNLICDIHYFKDGKPQTGQLVIQGNKVGLTDSQGEYLKEVGQ